MNDTLPAVIPWDTLTAQPNDVRGLHKHDTLIISATQVDGLWIIVSRYGDDIWQLDGFTSNVSASRKRMDFKLVPMAFRPVMKAMLYRYLRRGRRGGTRPKGSSMMSPLAVSKARRARRRYASSNNCDNSPLAWLNA